MLKKTKEYLKRRNTGIPAYGLLLFDHALGEYSSLADGMTDEEKEECRAIEERRKSNLLTWKDIYMYKLIMVSHYSVETLKSKLISLRVKYQCLVEAVEYNNYTTLRAFDLTKEVTEDNKEALQVDYTYLLDEFFLRYSYISAHEEFRTNLLRRAMILTFSFFIVLVFFSIYYFGYSIFRYSIVNFFDEFSTLIYVVFAGMMGGFVSIQQRLQAFSHEGDPILSLSLLTHGRLSIFLSPISGAIFAVILYLFFAAGILKGHIFPEMATYSANINSAIDLKDFIKHAGPVDINNFSLLMIWSFVAGFAERFVPDTIMRLIDQKKKGAEGIQS